MKSGQEKGGGGEERKGGKGEKGRETWLLSVLAGLI